MSAWFVPPVVIPVVFIATIVALEVYRALS